MTFEQRGETLLEEGVVLSVIPAVGDKPAHARVRLLAGDHCEGCPASVICKPESGDKRLMDVIDPVGVAVGDRVRVMVPGGAVLKASFLVYGLPLLLMLAGVWLGTRIWSAENGMRDLWSFLLGAGLAGGAFPLVRAMMKRAESEGGQMLEPVIDGRVEMQEAAE